MFTMITQKDFKIHIFLNHWHFFGHHKTTILVLLIYTALVRYYKAYSINF